MFYGATSLNQDISCWRVQSNFSSQPARFKDSVNSTLLTTQINSLTEMVLMAMVIIVASEKQVNPKITNFTPFS